MIRQVAPLAWSWLRRQQGRVVLTVVAIAVAASLIMFTLTAYQAALERSKAFARETLGAYDVVVLPQFALEPRIPHALDDALQAQATVKSVHRVQVTHGDIEDVKNTTYYEAWRTTFIGSPLAEAPMPLAKGSWLDARADGQRIGGVVSGGLAKRWRVDIGDTLPATTDGGVFDVEVIGITREQLAHNDASGVFVRTQDLVRLAGRVDAPDRLYLTLHDPDQSEQTLAALAPIFASTEPSVRSVGLAAVADDLGSDKAIKRVRNMGASAAVITVLAALFMVYAAMSAAMVERQRQLAVLRCVGATRKQVIAAVLLESGFLSLLGCVAGLVLSVGWLGILAIFQTEIFAAQVLPSLAAVVLAVVSMGLVSILAGLLPALRAARTKPLDGLQAHSARAGMRGLAWRGAVGAMALLLAVLGMSLSIGNDRGLLIVQTGMSLLLLGLAALFLVPHVIVFCDKVAMPLIAKMLGIPYDLIQGQLSAHLSRSVGTVLTIAVCLGLSVMLNIWGRTMVQPFLPSQQLPDVVVSIIPSGLPPEHEQVVAEAPGVQRDRVLPMATEQTMLGDELIAQSGGNYNDIWMQLIGVDPALAFTGEKPLLPLTGETDTLANLAVKLEQPLSCLLPPSLAERYNLAVGDTIPVKKLGSAREEVSLTIVGLSAFTGWQWVTKLSRMRSLGGKPQAPIIISRDTAEALGIGTIRHWYVDNTPDYDRATLRQYLTEIADKYAANYNNAHLGPAMAEGASVKVIATGEVRDRMEQQSGRVIWVLGAIPLAALAIAALGIANAMMMSVRARAWELGVLRSVGLSARQSGRLLLAEALLLSCAAAVLSVPLAALAAKAAIDVSLLAWNAGGSTPALALPWIDIVIAIIITTAAALLASWGQARRLARSTALELMQRGKMAG